MEVADRVGSTDIHDALIFYHKAESLYTGPLFGEDPFDTTFSDLRRTLYERRLHVLSKLIHLYEEKQVWKECIIQAEKYLAIDHCAEPVYRDLMKFHSVMGQTSCIVRAFERCKAAVEQDLGCALSPQTISLYRSLTQKRPADIGLAKHPSS